MSVCQPVFLTKFHVGCSTNCTENVQRLPILFPYDWYLPLPLANVMEDQDPVLIHKRERTQQTQNRALKILIIPVQYFMEQQCLQYLCYVNVYQKSIKKFMGNVIELTVLLHTGLGLHTSRNSQMMLLKNSIDLNYAVHRGVRKMQCNLHEDNLFCFLCNNWFRLPKMTRGATNFFSRQSWLLFHISQAEILSQKTLLKPNGILCWFIW